MTPLSISSSLRSHHRCSMRCIVHVTQAPDERAGASAPVYAEAPAELWQRLATRPDGLTDEEVARRGPPASPRRPRGRGVHALDELAESLVEPLQLLLILVGVLSAIFGQLRDAIAIFAIIGLVAAL